MVPTSSNVHLPLDRAPAQAASRAGAPLSVLAAFPLAALIAVTSLGGILSPAIYAHETSNWTAQAQGQDWFDLLVAVPFLILTGWRAARGGRCALLLLAGGLGYALYEFLIYAFALHFNALFLVYCAALGTSFFALTGLARRLSEQDVAHWYQPEVPIRGPGLLLCGVGIVFAALWLAASRAAPAPWGP